MATPMTRPGQIKGTGDELALFLKVFGGETLAAFERTSVAMPKFVVRTITSGKSAQFPVSGRATAQYLPAGTSLDTFSSGIQHNEKVINIDGLLTAVCMIFDLDDAMNHYDVASEYSRQLGEVLAVKADSAVLAELAKGANTKTETIPGLGKAFVLQIASAPDDITDPTKAKTVGEQVLAALATARAKLSGNYVPASERYVFVKPEVYSSILAASLPQNANFSALTNQNTGVIENIFGFTIVEVPHLADGGADKTGAVYATGHDFPATGVSTTAATDATRTVGKDNVVALIGHRYAVGTVKLKDLSIDRAHRIEFQGDMIVAKYAMGHDVLRTEACGAIVSTKA